ncbi:MAG: cytochrome P450 [Hyalangium sp.]|uniref:cytochrome P450 n=1 Tax=Hyalangium sp. TaxID=2028555 RepID=UPI00389B3380
MLHPDNHNPARPAVDFNPYGPGHDVNPYPVYEKLRAESPIAWWAQNRAWLVSRYDDIIAVLRDTKRFTSDRNEWELAAVAGTATQIPELAEMNRQSLLSVGNQDHVRLRKLISPALTPRAIERLRPDIQAIVDEILDSVRAKGTVNVVTDIADHIPARVIGSMLSMPKGREALFQRFTEAVVKTFIPALVRPEDLPGLRADIREGMVLIRETIEDRRRNPMENDILTTLIQTEEQGDKLNTQELLSLVSGLIVGGFETTIHLIGFTVFHLLTQPGLLAQVKAEPELLKGVIDEVLRFDHFGKMGIARYALEDVELGGQQIKKGQMLLLMLGSGLRDESAFDKAEVFDVRRTTNASIAFGHGAHYCIGASLARLEVQIAVGTLIQRFPELKLTQAPSFGPHPVIRRMETLELRLRPE